MDFNTSGSLLFVDDDWCVQDAMGDYLRSQGYRTETASSCDDAIERMREFPFEVVVCDVSMPDKNGFDLLQWARRHAPECAVILLTGLGSIESAVEAIRMGAFDYLTKPVHGDELNMAIQRAREQNQARSDNPSGISGCRNANPLHGIVGRDFKMMRMFELIERVANTRSNVLVLGESGTGKTVTARAIHQLSNRADRPFVEVACGALSDTLLESELFGHVAGAFTDATHDKTGKFLQADGGTLFLDEIATASPQLQIKLLRVLQDGEFEPVGSTQTHRVDVRLVLATNEDLEKAVDNGQFRADLYYRINVISLTQPSLRDRAGDIPLLVEHYLKLFSEQTGRTVHGFDDQAMNALQLYHWPGNVRELVNVIERAVVLGTHDYLSIADLPEKLFTKGDPDESDSSRQVGPLKKALSTPERQLIIQALESNGWNRVKTAKALNINRTTLYKKMKRHDIEFESVYRHC